MYTITRSSKDYIVTCFLWPLFQEYSKCRIPGASLTGEWTFQEASMKSALYLLLCSELFRAQNIHEYVPNPYIHLCQRTLYVRVP